jgi:hypothetical protein
MRKRKGKRRKVGRKGRRERENSGSSAERYAKELSEFE